MVESDKINPLLDVTFDGTHILNGDVISAKPHVLITLKDENKFLALNDTSNFMVYIKYPNQASEKRLYFSNGLIFTPANLPSNSCKIEWKPEFAIDGKYALRVQAADRSRNASGAVDYTIQFEVITKQTITEVLNYPNPFSTSTRFVFTLTGTEVPDIFTIQIMTITGKVVREINRNELGNVHIGRNITDYAWDGKDEYGDKLGNGVYLYRVITRSNGQAIEKNATDADSFFKKGVGKMVIMR
jgi:flagellar hook assembly protein FlgD